MKHIEIILTIAIVFMKLLYGTYKLKMNKKLSEIISEVIGDLVSNAFNVADIVIKARGIVFDESIQKAIKKFLMIIEEKNRIQKKKVR